MPPSSSRLVDSLAHRARRRADARLVVAVLPQRRLRARPGAAIARAHLGLIAAAVARHASDVRRCARWRWQVLLRPHRPRAVSQRPFARRSSDSRRRSCCRAAIGEVLRPYLLARAEGFNAGVDVRHRHRRARARSGHACCCSSPWRCLSDGVDVGPRGRSWPAWSPAAVGGRGLGDPVRAGAGHPERLGRWAGRLARRAARRASRGALAHLVQTFAEGLAVMRSPAPLVVAIVPGRSRSGCRSRSASG